MPPPAAHDVSPQVYRVKLADESVVGPMSYPRLIELFATGRVGSSTRIAREAGPFKIASEYSELTRFVSSPALRWDDDLTLNACTAKVDRALLPARLFQLALARDTGVLVLKDGSKRKKIYMVEGTPEFVASTDKRELLGEQLVSRGQILRMEVDMALAMLPRFGGRLGDALVGLGVLRPIELFRAIHEQTQMRFLEVFRWRKGEFGFVRGARSHEETFPLGVDPFELIARGVREAYSAEEIAAIVLPYEEEILAPVPRPPVRVESFRLPEREAAVLRLIEGETTLSGLMERVSSRSTADTEETLRAIFLGLSFDLLESPAWVTYTSVGEIRVAKAAVE